MNKLTKDDLAKMSDFDIFEKLSDMTGTWISECQRWCDLMPLAVEHGINLIKLDSSWAATNNAESYIIDSSYRFNEVGGVSCWHSSPQRAIACCLILVLQEREA